MKNIIITLFMTLFFIACGNNTELIKVGSDAPDFTLSDSEGNSFTLSSIIGEAPIVLYFYPKAGTPGCTTEACGIRDEYSKFIDSGIKVYGISVDDKESIREFIKENNLNFPLLSDVDKLVSQKYGVLNSFGLSSRVSFIIDKNGKIANIIDDVNVDTHANDVYDLAYNLL